MKSFISLAICLIATSAIAGNSDIGSSDESAASPFELTESCRQSVLKSLKTRQIESSFLVSQATGGNLAPFVGVACDNVPLKVRQGRDEDNAPFITVTAKVNPWHGPSRNLTAKCDAADIAKLPVVQVTVRSHKVWGPCHFEITEIQREFDLND